jgi:TrmH family RNA methyltransferase
VLTPEQIGNVRIVMVRTRNPLNVGASARAMSNFGFLNLRVVQPYDAAFREARSAVDAEPVLTAAVEFQDVAHAIADCSLIVGTTAGGARHTLEPIQRLEAGAEIIRQHLQSGGKVAMLFGSEKVGLSNDDLNHCHLLLRIPTRTEHLSMNLGQSVAISLYELVRDSADTAKAIPLGPRRATAEERDRFLALLLHALSLSNYFPRGTQHSTEQRLRRLLRHVPVTQRDLQEWLGLIRQIVWKLESSQSQTSHPHE